MLVRVIPGVTADTHAHVLTGHEGSKFGLLPAEAARLIARIERSPRLRMRGLHVHVGSQILAVEPFADCVAPIAALGEFEVYDLGGGLGARYSYDDHPPSVGRLPRRADRRRARAPARGRGADHRARPQHGRVRRLHALPRRHRSSATSWPSTAAWATTSRSRCSGSASRPAIADRFGGERARDASSGATARAATCSSTACALDAPRVGDLLAVPATGAYCHTMANNYNGTRRIPVVFAGEGDARAVVRRETWDDLLARDV